MLSVEADPPAVIAASEALVGVLMVAVGVVVEGASTARGAAVLAVALVVSAEVVVASSVGSIVTWVTTGAASARTVVVVTTVAVEDGTGADGVGAIISLGEPLELTIWLDEPLEPVLVPLLDTIDALGTCGAAAAGAAAVGAAAAEVAAC
jgi:hypothetical protein